MPKEFGDNLKILSFKTNNVNAQIMGFLLNVPSSYAKIRVPDPLLVFEVPASRYKPDLGTKYKKHIIMFQYHNNTIAIYDLYRFLFCQKSVQEIYISTVFLRSLKSVHK